MEFLIFFGVAFVFLLGFLIGRYRTREERVFYINMDKCSITCDPPLRLGDTMSVTYTLNFAQDDIDFEDDEPLDHETIAKAAQALDDSTVTLKDMAVNLAYREIDEMLHYDENKEADDP